MDNLKNGVPFDPGFSPYIIHFSDSIQAIKFELSKFKAMHQKKFKFKSFEPHIKKLFDNTISFYLGCLLWAAFINNRFKDTPTSIKDNPFLEIDKEKIDELDFMYEINFVLEYITQFDKDCKYYSGKNANLNPLYIEIAKTYKEFLEINNNFIEVKSTSDLKLPKKLQHFNNFSDERLDEVYSKIKDSISNGNIESLLELKFYE